MLPCSAVWICHSPGRMTDLRLFHLEDITAHYAETLALWRQRFRANLDQVRAWGSPMTSSAPGSSTSAIAKADSANGSIGDVQILLAKPACRLPPILAPWSP